MAVISFSPAFRRGKQKHRCFKKIFTILFTFPPPPSAGGKQKCYCTL
ncbi:MAG: hypothetical protein LBR79_04285 [Oscillospiraceae bacterium]|nr:hypothetical protein [Oscillospiraceae bacterium]